MECITLELRPRLQTCNAFIQLKENISSKQIEVKASEESITLIIGNEIINFLLKVIKIIPTSLSALSITNNWIYFRVQTKSNSAFGSIRTEIVTDLKPKTDFLKCTYDSTKLLAATAYTILCTCCKNVICKTAFFKRVLPLPDIDYDLSEWFCCAHSCNSISTDLSPRESDLFYGPFFIVLHKKLFADHLKIDDNHVICNRCLKCLGELYANDSFKIWSCCVDYGSTNDSATKTATDPLTDFFLAIKTSLTGIFGEEIILRCLTKKETHSLVIKPMDWNLDIMTEPKVISDDNIISLQKKSVVKVLYKYKTNENVSDSIDVKYCEVPLPIIEAGLKHLLLSTKRFPQLHRVASDYYIGHIHLEKASNDI